MYLLIVDTTQIQTYIFGSNRLQENIGASHLVTLATGEWALQSLTDCHLESNVLNIKTIDLDDDRHIDNPEHALDVEVVYAGGGNFLAIFAEESGVKEFIRTLSRKVMQEAPNLKLLIHAREFTWVDQLYVVSKQAFAELECQKQYYARSVPTLGLSVTVNCRSTGLPAIGKTKPINDTPGYPASAEIHAKLAYTAGQRSRADLRLAEIIPPGDGFLYPKEFDDMGRSFSEQSFLAVVHADGDGMGDRIRRIGENYQHDNRGFVREMRKFSKMLREAGQRALSKTQQSLSRAIKRTINSNGEVEAAIVHQVKDKDGRIHELARIQLKRSKHNNEENSFYLPFRPLVFGGGEDITFVCDGRLGITLAMEYLTHFEAASRGLPGGKSSEEHATACAGVAIVKTHYPFARAYALAEELCRSAKELRKELHDSNGWHGCCFDWHFALSGLSGDIEEIRRQQYRVKAGSLTLRPVTFRENSDPHKSIKAWPVVDRALKEFQGPQWVGRRNKQKALREALRDGPDAVKRFLLAYGLGELINLVEDRPGFQQSGWEGDSCGYFDALELADFFIPL